MTDPLIGKPARDFVAADLSNAADVRARASAWGEVPIHRDRWPRAFPSPSSSTMPVPAGAAGPRPTYTDVRFLSACARISTRLSRASSLPGTPCARQRRDLPFSWTALAPLAARADPTLAVAVLESLVEPLEPEAIPWVSDMVAAALAISPFQRPPNRLSTHSNGRRSPGCIESSRRDSAAFRSVSRARCSIGPPLTMNMRTTSEGGQKTGRTLANGSSWQYMSVIPKLAPRVAFSD